MKRKFGDISDHPDPLLLALVSQFLSNHGFNASLRIFNTERRKRPQKHGFEDAYGEKFTRGIPQLDVIFKDYMSKEKIKQNEHGHNSDNESPDASETGTGTSADSSETSSSESDTDSEEEMSSNPSQLQSEKQLKDGKAKPKTKYAEPTKAPSTSTSDSSDSFSETNEAPVPTKPLSTSSRSLKRKVDSSSSQSESSSSDADSSSDDEPARKKTKTQREGESENESTESSSDSSSDEDSKEETSSDDSDSDEVNESQTQVTQLTHKPSPDSSDTIAGEEVNGVTRTVKHIEVKKHSGAKATRLAELSAKAGTGEYISNGYVSYNYADRAYKDLSVTRGKGFTKEKNKKKRGSYRGGMIDINGGKSFKFDD